MLFLKQLLMLPFLCHKSATTCQIDSYKVSNSKLTPDLCHCLKHKMIESKAAVQKGHNFLGKPVLFDFRIGGICSLVRH